MATTQAPQNETVQNALVASQSQISTSQYLQGVLKNIRSGNLGVFAILLGWLAIALVFQSQAPNFLTPFNLTNLVVQMAGVATIAYGVVFILLLGEIDLSVSYVSAVAGVLLALGMLPPYNVPWYFMVPIALLAAAAIGWLHGFIITTFQLPSFVVTLAGFLAWSGVVLILIGGAGTVVIQQSAITALTRTFLAPEVGWLVGGIGIVLYAVTSILSYNARKRGGLATKPMPIVIAQIVIVSAAIIGFVAFCNTGRGVPLAGIYLVAFMFILTYIAENTKFGRYVYAVGGNKEAARRAGIQVERIRIFVFMLASFMAGIGGIFLAARLGSVATNAGGGDLLLNSIAAAVIGGTSLFGGRGKVYSALVGALIVMTIDNGLGLIPNVSAGARSIVTGLVLLAAVIIDALSRRKERLAGAK
jgi:D-xylose transport system permease protein